MQKLQLVFNAFDYIFTRLTNLLTSKYTILILPYTPANLTV
jgi:hypothetical protein